MMLPQTELLVLYHQILLNIPSILMIEVNLLYVGAYNLYSRRGSRVSKRWNMGEREGVHCQNGRGSHIPFVPTGSLDALDVTEAIYNSNKAYLFAL